ncbi:UNVERIFIED_CONTAM: hypothetical protein FKN15_011261 [Acipenser sinensis]
MPFRYETSLRELNYTSGEYRVRERERTTAPSIPRCGYQCWGMLGAVVRILNPLILVRERCFTCLDKELQLPASLTVGTSAGACWEL